MWEIALGFVADFLSNTLPQLFKKREPSENKKYYDELRREIAEALSMYACCFYNPVDLADYKDHKLPPFYEEGSHRLRELASKLKAFAEIISKDKTDVPINVEEMHNAAGCLYGISNSFHTPYGTGRSFEDMNSVRQYEDELRVILNLKKWKYNDSIDGKH